MPVEIRELVIKAFVDTGNAPAGGPARQPQQEDNLLQYLDQVLEIVDNQNER